MDSILYWNAVALEANRVSHTNGAKEQTGPTLSSRALAIVHLAMYDAYAGINVDAVNLPPYMPGLPPPGAGADSAAGVAAAAHATLSSLFPAQRAFFDKKLREVGLSGGGIDAGRSFGQLVALGLLADRKGDPDASDAGWCASMAPKAHRLDPDNPGQGFYAPFYGAKSKGFAITTRLELDSPTTLTAAEYQRAEREVRGKGIAPELMGTLPSGVLGISRRTVDETLIGVYWGYDGALEIGTPPRLYNQIVREVANAQGNDEKKNARLFALVNAAMADAGILAWDQKYIHNFWRPVVGIREDDLSLGPAGQMGSNIDNDCDPCWLPLGAPASNSTAKNFTPPFPAYPSGHATFGAAAFHITRLFFNVASGDQSSDLLFAGKGFVSDEFNGETRDNKGTVRPKHTRSFANGLWQMIEENARSRVFLGVHWVFDSFAVTPGGAMDLTRNIGGVPLGLNIAEEVFAASQSAGWKSPVGPRP